MERQERGTKDGSGDSNTKEKSTKETEKELPARQGEGINLNIYIRTFGLTYMLVLLLFFMIL